MSTNKTTADEKGDSKLDALIDVMEELRTVNPDMTVLTALAFMRAAKTPGIPMSKLQEQMDVAQSTVSRNIATLSKWAAYQKEGANLVASEEDPRDRRQRIVSLTPKGEKLVEKMVKTLDA